MIDSLSLESQASTARITDWTSRLRGAVKSTCCVLMGGHWRVLHVSRNHMALRCVGCGDTTPGWQVGRPARREREQGIAPARRHAA